MDESQPETLKRKCVEEENSVESKKPKIEVNQSEWEALHTKNDPYVKIEALKLLQSCGLENQDRFVHPIHNPIDGPYFFFPPKIEYKIYLKIIFAFFPNTTTRTTSFCHRVSWKKCWDISSSW